MSRRDLLAELRRRGVLKVAVVYLATGVVVLEGVSILFQNFDAPLWALKAFTALVILGWPLACLMAWGFEFTPAGVHLAPAAGEPAAAPVPVIADASAPPSIAVLPFVDMSPEHDQQYLGDGIAEELLNAFTAISGLNVAARTSSFSFHGKDAGVQQIGAALHVRHVLEGSVRRSGTKLRITAQLIDVASGFHLFAQSYDREFEDIFAIQNDIARDVVAALLPKLGLARDAMLVRHGTTNLEAYNLHLEAQQWVASPHLETTDAALEKLQQAIALDRSYGDAWADLAYIHHYVAAWAQEPVPQTMKAAGAVAVALSLAPDNAMAQLVTARIAMQIERDAGTAAKWLDTARAAGIENSLWSFTRAYFLDGPLGHYEAAITHLIEAKRRDPLARIVRMPLIDMYLASGRIADAVAEAEALESLGGATYEEMTVCGLAFLAGGNIARARELVRGSIDPVLEVLRVRFPFLPFAICDACGDRVEAERTLEALLREGGSLRWLQGEGYKAIGDCERAIDAYTQALERYEIYALVRVPLDNRRHPVIGKHPRFLALLKRMGWD